MFATIPSPPSSATLSPSACFSNDHYTRINSPSSKLHVSRFVIVEKTSYVAGSPISAATSFAPSTVSLVIMQLCVDLFSYPLQQLTGQVLLPLNLPLVSILWSFILDCQKLPC